MPFPVDTARWRVDYSVEGEVGLEVYAWPKPNQGLRPTLFMMSMIAVGTGDDRHWLVDAWVPRGGRPDVLRQRVSGESPLQAAIAEQNRAATRDHERRLAPRAAGGAARDARRRSRLGHPAESALRATRCSIVSSSPS